MNEDVNKCKVYPFDKVRNVRLLRVDQHWTHPFRMKKNGYNSKIIIKWKEEK